MRHQGRRQGGGFPFTISDPKRLPQGTPGDIVSASFITQQVAMTARTPLFPIFATHDIAACAGDDQKPVLLSPRCGHGGIHVLPHHHICHLGPYRP